MKKKRKLIVTLLTIITVFLIVGCALCIYNLSAVNNDEGTIEDEEEQAVDSDEEETTFHEEDETEEDSVEETDDSGDATE